MQLLIVLEIWSKLFCMLISFDVIGYTIYKTFCCHIIYDIYVLHIITVPYQHYSVEEIKMLCWFKVL